MLQKIQELLDRVNKLIPAGHIGITPGEISPNSGPLDVDMSSECEELTSEDMVLFDLTGDRVHQQ